MRSSTIAVLFACCALPAQHLTFAEGALGILQIATVAETAPNGPATTVLQGVEFVGIELAARTLAQEFDPSRSRRVSRHGIARVELPGGGRLFRYRRLAGQYWGLLHVDAGGLAASALELPGTGAGGTNDPFADRIGVDTAGTHAVVPLRAGGFHVVRLDGGTFASTGRRDRFVPSATVLSRSLLVGSQHVFVQTANERLWRCALADGSQPVDVSPPAVPNGEWKEEMAMSRDGSRVVFLYGPRDQMRLWSIGTTGPATILPPPPSKYEEPDYLPEGPGEPAMLLNDDGSRLFFVDSLVRDELFLIDLAGALPPLQITEDAIFQPYIGVHILPKFRGPQLLVAIGDPGRMDWYRAELTAGGGAVANLTGTGSLQQPFVSGQIDPRQAAEAGSALLIAEGAANAFALRRLDPATGASAVVAQGLLAPPFAGSALSGNADLVARGSSGDRLYTGTAGALLATTPPGVLIAPPVHGPLIAATWVHISVGWGAMAFYLPDGTIAAGNIDYDVRQVCATPLGGFVIVGAQVRYVAPGANVLLQRPAAVQRLCLSGAGG